MHIFKTFITKDLINYLNNEDPYLQIETGIFQLAFQKRSDTKLDWTKIESLTDSRDAYLQPDRSEEYIDLNNYCKQIMEKSILYEPFGLEITIRIDIQQVGYIEDLKLSNDNAFFITPKVIQSLGLNTQNITETSMHNSICLNQCKIVERELKQLRVDCKLSCEIFKNILMSLFTNESQLMREQKRINHATNIESKIVINKKNVIIDGLHRYLILNLLSENPMLQNETPNKFKIKCILIDDAIGESSQAHTRLNEKTTGKTPNVEVEILSELEDFISGNSLLYDQFSDYCIYDKNSPDSRSNSDLTSRKKKILEKWIRNIIYKN